jgi:hypothetical protein
MRLLECHPNGRFTLTRNIADGEIPEYAILSHTWGTDAEEVTLGDLLSGTGQCKSGYEKLKFCARQATRDGLKHFWIDTCCIDQSNSPEVSEAINSMFRWYSQARRCYVYLEDVVSTAGFGQDSDQSWMSAFQASKWFTRGWTLQELIAPQSVEFFTRDGYRIGDKGSLEHQIHTITGVALAALQGAPLSQFSVEERFKWAEGRRTTREEDSAYCLLGIFDVFMPLIYGERKENAINRLRDEIDTALARKSGRQRGMR